jgi:hypothetical protein
MRFHRILAIIAGTLIVLSAFSGVARARVPHMPPAGDEAVVDAYFFAVNQALAGGGTEYFSAVIDPHATLTASNPSGVTTTVHGLPAIQRWFGAWARAGAGLQLTTTGVSNPTPGVVVHYEVAGNPANPTAARCAHVFVIRNAMIVSDNFITFYRAPAPAPTATPVVHHGRNHPS